MNRTTSIAVGIALYCHSVLSLFSPLACGLTDCADGYTLNSAMCSCELTDICVADNPCTNNGVCELVSSPDNYTCNCTGTNYMGTNCTGVYYTALNYLRALLFFIRVWYIMFGWIYS